jgi:thiol-disulfide isomerase/thioredoxin
LGSPNKGYAGFGLADALQATFLHAILLRGMAQAKRGNFPLAQAGFAATKRAMKRSRFLPSLARILTFTLASAALAQEEAAEPKITLKMGDPAPKLQVGKWIQGDAVTEFEKDKVYIVEFWATWCGPCRATIPHLNELHKKFKDKGLVVIGQNCWERDEAGVPDFVKEMGEKMTYRVALDDTGKDERGYMAINWMQASGQQGIPSAFIVGKDQKIAWIGHPGQLDEKLLEDVLAGTFDVAKAMKQKEEEDAQRGEMMKLQGSLTKAMRDKNWDEAAQSLDQLAKVMPERNRKFLDLPRFNILLGQKKAEDAYKLAEKLCEENDKSPTVFNQIAWGIITTEGIEKPNLDLAEKCARRAVELAPDEGKWMTLDTLARTLFLRGSKEEAVKTQQEAADKAPEPVKDRLTKALDSYKQGKLPTPDDE